MYHVRERGADHRLQRILLERNALHCFMHQLTISLKHVASERNQPCAVCAALFVPAEDTGSRVLSIKAPDENPVGALLCGGCYSKWTHGMTVTLRQSGQSVVKQP
jgi:hypothetical protein